MTTELKRKLGQMNQIIQWTDEGLLTPEEMKEKIEAKMRELFPIQRKVEPQDISVDINPHGEE